MEAQVLLDRAEVRELPALRVFIHDKAGRMVRIESLPDPRAAFIAAFNAICPGESGHTATSG